MSLFAFTQDSWPLRLLPLHFEDNAGPAMTYTNEVYALLPPNAIPLKAASLG